MLPAKPGGAGKYIIRLVQSLAALNGVHELVILAQRSTKSLLSNALTENLEWVLLADKRPSHRIVWEQAVLPSIVQRAQLDLLHSLHYTRPLLLGCKSVVTFHDMTFFIFPKLHTRFKRIFFPVMMRLSARLADALIAVSNHTREDAIRILNIPQQKIFATPLGVDPIFHSTPDERRRAEIRQKYRLPEQFILYVGAIEPRKNLPVLIDAFAQLHREGIPHYLVLVGQPGWMVERVYHQIEKLALTERILFTGYLPQYDLPIVYNLAQVLVYPSSYEGFGFPPLEAMACGTPVITSAISAMIENVGQAGILVPPQDESALRQALGQLLHNPEQRAQRAIQGREQAKKFTWERTAQQTLQVYQHVLKDS